MDSIQRFYSIFFATFGLLFILASVLNWKSFLKNNSDESFEEFNYIGARITYVVFGLGMLGIVWINNYSLFFKMNYPFLADFFFPAISIDYRGKGNTGLPILRFVLFLSSLYFGFLGLSIKKMKAGKLIVLVVIFLYGLLSITFTKSGVILIPKAFIIPLIGIVSYLIAKVLSVAEIDDYTTIETYSIVFVIAINTLAFMYTILSLPSPLLLVF